MQVQLDDSQVGAPSLNGLEESVHRIVQLITQLRRDRSELQGAVDELTAQVKSLETDLATARAATEEERTRVRRVENEWHTERTALAKRVDSLLEKLDRIES